MSVYRNSNFLGQKYSGYFCTLVLNNKLSKFTNSFKIKTRSISCTSINTCKNFKGEEVKIKVPWGHVAGKWWGPKDVKPMLGLHGWQDNAGTFDTLAPLLPADVSLLAIDFPGHGFSSQLPPGMFYTSLTYIMVCRCIISEYNWKTTTLIGHSMGSLAAFAYTALFPDEIEMLIQLDALKPREIETEEGFQNMRNSIDNLILHEQRLLKNAEPPSYEYKELVERLHNGSYKSITPDCCKYILDRNIKKSAMYPNKYFFTRDYRVKIFSEEPRSQESAINMAKRIKCPHLFIKASHSPLFEKKGNHEELLNVLKNNQNFIFHRVEGRHHVHLTNPSIVIEYIKDFIEKYRNNLEPHSNKLMGALE